MQGPTTKQQLVQHSVNFFSVLPRSKVDGPTGCFCCCVLAWPATVRNISRSTKYDTSMRNETERSLLSKVVFYRRLRQSQPKLSWLRLLTHFISQLPVCYLLPIHTIASILTLLLTKETLQHGGRPGLGFWAGYVEPPVSSSE